MAGKRGYCKVCFAVLGAVNKYRHTESCTGIPRTTLSGTGSILCAIRELSLCYRAADSRVSLPELQQASNIYIRKGRSHMETVSRSLCTLSASVN